MSFFGRITLTGTISVQTGLHIGTGGAGGIGLVDNPIIRDPISKRPIVPGSSLKGRLRHGLETLLGENSQRHPEVTRLFGGSADDSESGLTRLYVRDSHLTEGTVKHLESLDSDSNFVEVKTENRIDRVTGTAEHPRQAERLPAGSKLELEIVYNVYNLDEAADDLQNLRACFDFVEDEYLGGSGSRGYGRVKLPIDKVVWKTIDDYKALAIAKEEIVGNRDWLTVACDLCGLTTSVR
ncbi:MAG: type III-A CRISPR-associated RAMP protein Csm3 [Candidatus Obscuribacterales bacterium]|nr:type III-A CRISPR-associated RAMP protein Csm3 [Candidatus Obscuribacterales bacterium]